MSKETSNSRRSFLSTLALLGSGTVLAGSPVSLLDSSKAGNASLKKDWALLQKNNAASGFLSVSGSALPQTVKPIAGQQNKPGEIVSFDGQNLLAQPTWIYWAKNSSHPDDVVISFFENVYPYKKLKSINRFEMKALVQLPAEKNLLQALCNSANKKSERLTVKTHIGKRKTVQEACLFINNNIALKEQFNYNV